MVADLFQQIEDSTKRRPKDIHRHQAVVPWRHCCLHQHLLDVGDRRTPVLGQTCRQLIKKQIVIKYNEPATTAD